MRVRKYIVVMLLVWALIAAWTINWARESHRITRAEEEIKEETLAMGVEIFARNCVVCHGPVGEGHVGPPLNIAEFRGDPGENQDTYDMLYKTIRQGRPGSSDPNWDLMPDGNWASFTAMPAWFNGEGGPLNEQQIRAVTRFIMQGDWSEVAHHIPPATFADGDGDGKAQLANPADRQATIAKLLDAQGVSAEVNEAGKRIFVEKGCIACHTIGSVGGVVGPNLSKIGSWGVTEEFLEQWISDPQGTPNRAPVYWSNFGGPPVFGVGADQAIQERSTEQGGTGETTGQGVRSGEQVDRNVGGSTTNVSDIPTPEARPLPPTQMPKIPMSAEELETLVDYLMGLR